MADPVQLKPLIIIGVTDKGELGLQFECPPEVALNAVAQIIETLRVQVAVNAANAVFKGASDGVSRITQPPKGLRIL